MTIFSKLSVLVPFLKKPEHIIALEQGDKARDLRDWVAAIAHYTQYLESVPTNAAIHIQLGHCLKETGNHQAASASYDKAYALTPDDDDLALQIGHIEKLKGNKALALEWYERSVSLNSQNKNAIAEVEALRNEFNEKTSIADHQIIEVYQVDEESILIARRIPSVQSETIKQKQRFLSEKIQKTIKILENVQ